MPELHEKTWYRTTVTIIHLFNIMRYSDEIEAIVSTREQRQAHVDGTNAIMREAGLELNAEILELQRRYIEGEVSVMDLLEFALALMRTVDQREDQDVSLPPQNLH